MESKINSNFHLFGYTTLKNTKDDLRRHRWYSYKESFPSSIVESAILNNELKESSTILDIFNGAGTVTLTASIKGLNSIGLEVNPFSAFASKAKLINCPQIEYNAAKDILFKEPDWNVKSPLLKFSTFSEKTDKSKWLFNSSVLNAFESCWLSAKSIKPKNRPLFQLALLNAVMDNCNAVKDGKCLKYRENWDSFNFSRKTFLTSLEERLKIIEEDLGIQIKNEGKVFNCDSREFLKKKIIPSFDLCITSPPYLNSFDYTDIYRPELFLGKFINSSEQLHNLRYKTIRSHVEIKLPSPNDLDFGVLYTDIIKKISERKEMLWDKQIPIMIQAYFEDMKNTLRRLKKYSKKNGQVWLIVSNSAYAGIEIPVDLILAEIGCKVGWKLKEIGVLQYINKRITKHSPEIKVLRESAVIFSL